MILRDQKLLITPTRRVGGTSVTLALAPYLERPEDQELFNLGTLSGTPYGSRYPAHGSWAEQVHRGPFQDYLKVLMVRDPLEKLLSAYYFLRKSDRYPIPDLGFRDFILNRSSFEPQNGDIWLWDHTWRTLCEISTFEGVFAFDKVVRYESLESDINRVCNAVGIGKVTLSVHRASGRPAVNEAYDPETLQIVRQHFQEDFERFGY